MFEIPTNSAKDLRAEVVDLVCRAFFKNRVMWWSEKFIYADGTFRSCFDRNDGREEFQISKAERDTAIRQFRDKGWHVFKAEWYGGKGELLYRYELHETKRINPGSGYYIF